LLQIFHRSFLLLGRAGRKLPGESVTSVGLRRRPVDSVTPEV
jgi:hypothetical protein